MHMRYTCGFGSEMDYSYFMHAFGSRSSPKWPKQYLLQCDVFHILLQAIHLILSLIRNRTLAPMRFHVGVVLKGNIVLYTTFEDHSQIMQSLQYQKKIRHAFLYN